MLFVICPASVAYVFDKFITEDEYFSVSQSDRFGIHGMTRFGNDTEATVCLSYYWSQKKIRRDRFAQQKTKKNFYLAIRTDGLSFK